MFTGEQIVSEFRELGISHVVWLPDSTLGPWETALSHASDIKLVRVCREGEAWAIAAGLYLAGATPIVVIQCTGLFESGDSLRNAIHDYGLPLFALIGYRSFLNPAANDSARTYTEPTLRAWDVPYRLIERPDQLPVLAAHYRTCHTGGTPGVVLVGEGRL